MGCVDSLLQRYGSGEAKMRKLRGGRGSRQSSWRKGERDGKVNTNKTRENGMGKEW